MKNLYEAAKYDFYKDKLTPEVFDHLNSIYPKYSVWLIDKYLKSGSNAAWLTPESKAHIIALFDQYAKLLQMNFFSSELGVIFKNYGDIQKVPNIATLETIVQSHEASTFLENFKYRNY